MEVVVYPFRDGSVRQTDATFLHPETSQDFSWIGKMSPEESGASDPKSSTHDMMLEPPGIKIYCLLCEALTFPQELP